VFSPRCSAVLAYHLKHSVFGNHALRKESNPLVSRPQMIGTSGRTFRKVLALSCRKNLFPVGPLSKAPTDSVAARLPLRLLWAAAPQSVQRLRNTNEWFPERELSSASQRSDVSNVLPTESAPGGSILLLGTGYVSGPLPRVSSFALPDLFPSGLPPGKSSSGIPAPPDSLSKDRSCLRTGYGCKR
jgi:hypothetical protein